MGILDIEIVKGFMRMCNDGWLQGWHERNGGNLTYRMRQRHCHRKQNCCQLFHLLSPFRCLYICSAFSAQANPSQRPVKTRFFPAPQTACH